MDDNSPQSTGLGRITLQYLNAVRDEVTHCDDKHLLAWFGYKGTGPLASLVVQDILRDELSRRHQNVIWAVRWVHNTDQADAHWGVKNTSTGEEKSIRPVRNDEDKKFAVETVAGFAVEECGKFDNVTLYRAERKADHVEA